MDLVTYIAIVIGALALAALLFYDRNMPEEESFRCGGCSKQVKHSNRTIQAWRDGRSRFFCGDCHADWLKSQQPVSSDVPRRNGNFARIRAGIGFWVLLIAAVLFVFNYFS